MVLAFYAFFSIFPLLLVFVTVLGFVLAGDHSALVSVRTSALGEFPVIGQSISGKGLGGSVPALVVGVLLTLWSGLGVTGAGRHAMDVVWDVPKQARAGYVASKLHGVILLVCLGTLFVVASGASGLVAGGLGGPLLFIVGVALSLVMNFALFLVTFRLLCSEKLDWGAVVPGALLAAVLWELLQLAAGAYIGHIRQTASAYGTFALVLGILAWLHLGSQMVVFCAELNSVIAKKLWPRGLRSEPTPDKPR